MAAVAPSGGNDPPDRPGGEKRKVPTDAPDVPYDFVNVVPGDHVDRAQTTTAPAVSGATGWRFWTPQIPPRRERRAEAKSRRKFESSLAKIFNEHRPVPTKCQQASPLPDSKPWEETTTIEHDNESFDTVEFQHQVRSEQLDAELTGLLRDLDFAALNIEADKHAQESQATSVFMVSVEQSYKSGSALPKMPPLQPAELSFIKSAYNAPSVPIDLIGRTVRVHTNYRHPNLGYAVPQNSIGVIASRIDRTTVCITANGCGLFPIPLSNVHVGLDHCAKADVNIIRRNCKVLRKWANLEGDHCTIVKARIDGLSATVSYMDTKTRKNETKFVPGDALSVCAPSDAAQGRGRTVRMKNPDHKSVKLGTMGYVNTLANHGTSVEVHVRTGDVVRGPANDWEFGAHRGTYKFKIPSTRINLRGNATWSGNNAHSDDIKNHVLQLLKDIYTNRDSIEGFNPLHGREFNTQDKARDLATCFQDGIQLCSPNLLQVLKKDDFTMKDVLQCCKMVSDNGVQAGKNDSPGVYLRGYADFKGVARRGRRPYWYVGQTNKMNTRDWSHTNETLGQKMNLHYSTARDAQSRACVQLFQLPKEYCDDPDTTRPGRILEIIETCFMLLLHTTVLDSWEPAIADDISADQLASKAAASPDYVGPHHLATLGRNAMRDIASQSARVSKWSATRETLDMHDGLNQVMPVTIYGGITRLKEKTIWTVVSESLPVAPDGVRKRMCVYRRGTVILQQTSRTRFEFFNLRERGKHHFNFYAEPDDIVRCGPNPGTVVYIDFEVYDRGCGHHPVPLLRASSAHPMSNIDDVLSIGAKLYWRNAAGLWEWRYVTAPLSDQDRATDAPLGVTRAYADVTFLLAQLRNESLLDGEGKALKWHSGESHKPLRVMQAEFEEFHQAIELTTRSTRSTQLRVYKTNDGGAEAMRAAGLDNVGRTLSTLDNSGLSPKWRQMYRNRTQCDRCFLWRELRVQLEGEPFACTPDASGSHCQSCHSSGLVCSWTSTTKLLQGLEQYANRNTRPSPDKMPDFQKALLSTLFYQVSKNISDYTRTRMSKATFASVFLEELDQSDL